MQLPGPAASVAATKQIGHETDWGRGMDTILARLDELERKAVLLDILMLEGEYSRAWDFGTSQEWADLFTPDGVFEIPEKQTVAPLPGGGSMRLQGTAQLAQFHDAFGDNWLMLHQMHLPSVRLEGDRAKAVMFFECPIKASDNHGRAVLNRETGIYNVEYVKTAAGWKIASRVEHPVFRDGEHHFGRPETAF